jgi:hypothetical protein
MHRPSLLVLARCLSLLGLVEATGCKRRAPDPVAAAELAPPVEAAAAPSPAPESAPAWEAEAYDVHGWSFALDKYELRVVDVAMTTALDAVLSKLGTELVVNGGFFDPQGKPIGLAVSDGAVLSRLARKLSGGVVTSDGTRARLWESESFAMPEGTRFAIQCRPRLVVDGVANIKSDDGKRAARTALCLRDGGKTVEVVVVRGAREGEGVGPSLFALSHFLVRRGCEGAQNLDGGPSTGVAWREGGAVRVIAPVRPVRHGVSFARRTPSDAVVKP